MINVEEFILSHASADYDPVKAREYYLRTRQLKGRSPAALTPATTRTATGRPPSRGPSNRVTTAPKVSDAHRRQKEIEVRVAALRARLEELRNVLKRLVDEAQERSGMEPSKKTKGTSTEKPGNAKEKLSSSEKKEAAKRSEKYYDKNKDKLNPPDEISELKEKIKDVEERIWNAVAKAKAPVENARTQTTTMRRMSVRSNR